MVIEIFFLQSELRLVDDDGIKYARKIFRMLFIMTEFALFMAYITYMQLK